MYTKELGEDGHWYIMDPAGNWICHVESEHAADCLLSHLNRG